jgi:hypothetical protein
MQYFSPKILSQTCVPVVIFIHQNNQLRQETSKISTKPPNNLISSFLFKTTLNTFILYIKLPQPFAKCSQIEIRAKLNTFNSKLFQFPVSLHS